MHSDPFHPQTSADPQDGTALIQPVTVEALDAAAHKAAELADGVAHHTIAIAENHGTPETEAPLAPVEDEASLAPTVTADVSDAVQAVAEHGRPVGETMPPAAGSADRASPEAALALYGDKMIEIVQGNLAATTALFSALSQATSLPEAVAINADHMRRQLDVVASQGRDLARLGLDALKPLSDILRRGS